ncbi:MAG: preprotein translocase subunit SecG [Candidatus Azotimanducaceae bacterium]|jgi:preprotein translocase subunit SecG
METPVLETLVLIIHVLGSLAIIGLVLIQHGKGADMGSGFGGGASGTVFGSGGAGNFLQKTTTYLAIGFFLTSFGLAVFAKNKSAEVGNLGIPDVVQQAPIDVEIPTVDAVDILNDAEIPTLESDESEVPQG